MAVTVTDEMRRAVYDEDCRRYGHIISYDNALQFDEGTDGARIAGHDGRQPHISCRRCGRVWLIVEEPGNDYGSAALALDAKLLPQFRPTRVTVPKLPGLGGLL